MLIAKEDSVIAIMLKFIREYMWVKCAEIKSLKIPPKKSEDFVLINALFLKVKIKFVLSIIYFML